MAAMGHLSLIKRDIHSTTDCDGYMPPHHGAKKAESGSLLPLSFPFYVMFSRFVLPHPFFAVCLFHPTTRAFP